MMKQKMSGIDSKVAVSSKAPAKGKSQPVVGKLSGDMSAMPGSKGKGQAVATAKSNPIQGKAKAGTAMGSGGVLPGFA